MNELYGLHGSLWPGGYGATFVIGSADGFGPGTARSHLCNFSLYSFFLIVIDTEWCSFCSAGISLHTSLPERSRCLRRNGADAGLPENFTSYEKIGFFNEVSARTGSALFTAVSGVAMNPFADRVIGVRF